MATTTEAPSKEVEDAAVEDVVEVGGIDNNASRQPEEHPGVLVRDSDWIIWDVNGEKQAFVQAKATG